MGLLRTMLSLLLWLLSAVSLLPRYSCGGTGSALRQPRFASGGFTADEGHVSAVAGVPYENHRFLRATRGHGGHGSAGRSSPSGGPHKGPQTKRHGGISPPGGSDKGKKTKHGGHGPARGSSPPGGSGKEVISVLDFGAKGDGSSDDSKAFASAWAAACSSASAVSFLVPEGKSYLLLPVTFSGPCKSDVTVMMKGTIMASPNRKDWNGKNLRRWITFDGVKNLKVEGGGTFNGNGHIWWKNSCKVNKALDCTYAPTAVTFYSCTNLDVDGIRFKDSQQMHVTFDGCSNVRASNLFISAPESSPNTDGIHVTDTTNIRISSSVIQTGDDCISIVSGSRYVNATNIRCGPGHGISIGSLGENGEHATVSDVLVDTAQLEGTANGVQIKTWQGGRGLVKGIVFRNIVMRNVNNPIIIDQNYCDSAKKCPGEQKSAVAVRDVTYKDITGTSSSTVALQFDCSKAVPCRGIVLQNVKLALPGGDSAKSVCNNVFVTKSGTVVPSPCK